MELDPELLKQLTATFNIELEEQSQVMTDGLLLLEKNNLDDDLYNQTVASIFRAAHNIKGAARSLGIKDIGEIAHHIETLFSAIQKKEIELKPEIINICLAGVDKMRLAMDAFMNKTLLPFNLEEFLLTLSEVVSAKSSSPAAVKTMPSEKKLEAKAKNKPTQHESIRVSIENLERVSALMEEIQINKITMDEHYLKLSELVNKTKNFNQLWKQTLATLKPHFQKLDDNIPKLTYACNDEIIDIQQSLFALHKTLRAKTNDFAILSNSLQDEIRRLRLVPAATLFQTLPLAVRDLAQQLNKSVALDIKGDDVKMDKMVLDGLKDPLLHLIRNALDHGIEEANERHKLGKPDQARISINIIDEGDEILISLTDDGAGIDTKKILETALNKNIIDKSAVSNMNENDILELIFRPGFSTSKTITDVSGRGVGLDVVKTNLVDLKGRVSVKTEINKGTTFYLRVPLTLSSERGLLITAGGQPFVIPTNSVERVSVLMPHQIFDVEGGQAVMLDDHPVSLRHLTDILHLEKRERAVTERLPIIFIKKSAHLLALLVDEIIGEREMVIKPLQAPLLNITAVSGGTLSGSGQVIIVLNSNDLINTALHMGQVSHINAAETMTSEDARPHILVVDDSITTRTLEQNILENKGYKVTVAVNGSDAWNILQEQKFSLVVTDISMPLMDGFTLTERIKQTQSLQDIPVIIVTSLGSDAEKKRGIEVGANAYIVKNEFESGVLLEMIEQFI